MLLVLSLALGAAPEPVFACPAGTTRHEQRTPEARELWCATAEGGREGPRHAFFADGGRWFTGEYRAGKRSGEWRFWFGGGALRSAGRFVDDKRHGHTEVFHEGGGVAMAGECKDGIEVGTWTRWYPNGKKELEIIFGADGAPGDRSFYSRRGAAIDARQWTAERARGVDPTSPAFAAALAQHQRDRFFNECAS